MAGETEVRYGKYEGVESKTAAQLNKQGNWTIHNMLVGGQKLGLGFDKKLVSELPIGQGVKVNCIKDTKGYWKVESIEKCDNLPIPRPQTVAQTAGGADVPVQGGQRTEVQLQIVRQTAVKVAADIVNSVYSNPDAKKKLDDLKRVNRVVILADHLTNYVLRGTIDPVNEEGVKKLAEALVEAPVAPTAA